MTRGQLDSLDLSLWGTLSPCSLPVSRRTLYGYTVSNMDRDRDKRFDAQRVAQCARRLRERWPHADVTSLEEAAIELLDDEVLRSLAPADAAECWLMRAFR
jgi:hypothetical protein